nr:DUF6290 family protein [uncultured Devosia sp.]
MIRHTIKFEIEAETYEDLQSLAKAKGVDVDSMLQEAFTLLLEDAEDMAAIAEYERQKAEGTLETIPFADIKLRLGLDR